MSTTRPAALDVHVDLSSGTVLAGTATFRYRGATITTEGQQLGNSRGHFDVSAGDGWDLVIDTDHLTPAETAVRIANALGTTE